MTWWLALPTDLDGRSCNLEGKATIDGETLFMPIYKWLMTSFL